ncbi:MAG TPA: TonB-dependent receptor [Bryobacteraceae bacterium]|nr:TonB-dependent receptor [Bryobacteraceae bacterium]
MSGNYIVTSSAAGFTSRVSVRYGMAVLVLAYFVSTAAGQSTFGSITGVVRDPTGAAIPDAGITVTNRDTGVSRHASSGADGVYSVTDLLPGTYTVRAEAKGFSLLERKDIVLDANRVVNVDAQLALGSSNTKVEVEAAAPVINTETSTTSFVKTANEIVDTPLLMRQSHSNLGFAVYNPGANIGSSAEIMANGIRTLDSYSSTDGIVEMADPDGVGGGQISPDMDSIAEVNYILVDAPAEFKSPVNFTTVTKSGTNQFHGMGFYEYNSNQMNARNFFSATVPYHVYNDFVVNLGGPIRRNKTFFFFNYDGEYNRTQTVVTANTPLLPWRSGDFSGLTTIIKDPLTGQPFPNNQIPASRFNQQGVNTLNYFYPLPDFGNPTLQSGNWRGANPGRGGPKTTDGRIDHNFSERDAVFARLTYRHILSHASYAFMPPLGTGFQQRDSTTAALSWTHTFSPGLINEIRAGVGRNSNRFYPNLVGSDILSQLGIPGITTEGIHGVPYFSITGLTGTNQSTDGLSLDTDFHYSDNLSWTRGRHSMKFGFEAIKDDIGGYTIGSIYGTYNFTGAYSGNAIADLLLGLPQTVGLSIPTPMEYLHGTMWAMFAQDQWKVTSRLAVNYGLRYELAGPYYDSYGRIYTVNAQNGDLVVPSHGLSSINPLYPNNIPIETASEAGYPNSTLVRFPKLNFYPRAGIAYKLTADGKTAIRAGFGMYGNTIYGAIAQSLVGGPFSGSETLTNAITAGTPAFTLSNPFTSGATGKSAALQNVTGINPNMRTPYLEQWNVTLERQIGTMGLSLAYVGSHGVDLLYDRNLNQPHASTIPFSGYTFYPKLGVITWIENGATQSYNALQLAAVKHLGKELTFTTGFTWAKDLTDQEDQNWVYGQLIQNQYNLRSEWGNNSFTPQKRFIAEMVYSLPFGNGQKMLNHMPRLANAVLGGWRLSSVATLQSGQYFTPSFSGFSPSNTNLIGGRPDVVPGVSVIPSGGQTINNWFNLAAFAIPGCPAGTPVCSSPANAGRFGNAGINILEGPPMKNIDLALMKNFHMFERFVWQFEVQAQDVLNHPNFGNPSGNISSPATGAVITATNANDLQGSGASRSIYVMVKVNF